MHKRRKQRWIALLGAAMMILPGASSFAASSPIEEAPVPEQDQALVREVPPEEDPVKEEKQPEEKKLTPEQEKEKPKESGGRLTLTVTGDGIVTIKEDGADETTKQSVTKDKAKTLESEVGKSYEVVTYKTDDMTAQLKGSGVTITKQKDYTNQSLYKVTMKEKEASLMASFNGAAEIKKGDISLFSTAPASRAANSMTISVSMSKYLYGYGSGGSSFSPNQYGMFQSRTANVYGDMVFCAEHDRTATTGRITGTVINDATIRKILYYGYKGPKQWSGFKTYASNYKVWAGGNTNATEACGVIVTSQALSNRYNAIGGAGTRTNPAGLTQFMNYINKQPDPKDVYTVYRSSQSSQDMMWGVYSPKGKLKLVKKTANNSSIVKECPNMYSLAGAKYTVYKGNTKKGVLTTDKNGKSNTLSLNAGTYKVKETTAPKGFTLNTKTYSITVSAGKTATLNVEDTPAFDPVTVLLEKTATDDSYVNDAVMEGAEFTISYYDTLNKDAIKKKNPVRTWKLTTKKQASGNYEARLGTAYLLEGSDPFFTTEKGTPVLPRGIITIQETKAPLGYNVDPTVYVKSTDKNEDTGLMSYNFGNTPEQPNAPLKPSITTEAMDVATGDHVGTKNDQVTLTDTISYKELSDGITYTVKGELRNADTDEVLLSDGKPVTAEKTFTVTKDNSTVTGKGASGEITLTYDVKGKDLEGITAVAYAEVDYEGETIAEHKELTSEEQSVHFPKIETTAQSEVTDSSYGAPRKEETLTDTVAYENLVPGMTYTLHATLMDKETGEALTDENGEPITVTKTFTPEKAEGTVDVEITYDSSLRQGETTVFFEEMYHKEKLVAIHADIDDEGQSIKYPDIHTNADLASSGHMKGQVYTLEDNVTYTNLAPEREYKIHGILMDRATGAPLLENGKTIESEVTFTPEEPSGSETVAFKVKGKTLSSHDYGGSTVVFEKLYDVTDDEEEEIAKHEDLNDENQTVSVGIIRVNYTDHDSLKPGDTPKTGDEENVSTFLLLMLASATLLVGVTLLEKRRRDHEENALKKEE